MPLVSGGGGGGSAYAIPIDTLSSPAGTELEVDEFGNLTLIGIGGNSGVVTVKDDVTSRTVRASSNYGLRVTGTGGVRAFQASRVDGFPGGMVFHYGAAPADANLDAGDCALWLDPTNGASKLMIKAKQNDGAVVTASVALA